MERISTIESQVRQSATRNAQLLQILAETDHALPALEQRSHFIADLDSQIRSSDERLKTLKIKCETGLKEHEKFRHSQVRRFVYRATGKTEAFAHKEETGERDYMNALQKVQRESSINEKLKEQRRDATRARLELESAAKRHREAQRKLNELYHTIFAGPTPQFPKEDEAEKMCHRLVLRYRSARRSWEAESRAVQLLAEGESLMDEALAQTRDALSYSRAEALGGGRNVYEMMEGNRLAKADRLVALALLQVSRAQKASPLVKTSSTWDPNHGQVVRGPNSKGAYGRMTFRDQAKRNVGDTQRCADEMKRELLAARQRQAQLQADLDRRRAQLEEGRATLQKAREEVFATVVRDRAMTNHDQIVPAAHARVVQGGEAEPGHEEQGEFQPEMARPEMVDGVVHV